VEERRNDIEEWMLWVSHQLISCSWGNDREDRTVGFAISLIRSVAIAAPRFTLETVSKTRFRRVSTGQTIRMKASFGGALVESIVLDAMAEKKDNLY